MKFEVGQKIRHESAGSTKFSVALATPNTRGQIVIENEDGYFDIVLEEYCSPLPKRHTIGGIVWEEVDHRVPRDGETILRQPNNTVIVNAQDYAAIYTILKPIAIEEKP